MRSYPSFSSCYMIFALLITALFASAAPLSAPANATDTIEARFDGVDTNAARLAKGLPLLKPRVLHEPTRVRRASPSNLPPKIRVMRASTNADVGYFDGANFESSTTNTFDVASDPGSGPYAIENLSDTTKQLALYNTGSSAVTLSTTSYPSTVLGSTTSRTAAGAASVKDSSSHWVQTTIFSVDPTTKQITAQYVNPDLSVVPVQFVRASAYIYATGNATAFLKTAPSSAYVVYLYFSS